jgi:hypothetical protein
MMYGEIFMNLERNSKRTAEISKLLFDIYKSEIKFSGDTGMTVSFSQNATISLADLNDTANFKLPFGIGAYEPTLMFSLLSLRSVDMNTLDQIRTRFVENYFNNKMNLTYPNILFDYQKKIMEAGQLEAYNHWILMMGDEAAFTAWESANTSKWENFVKWFKENALEVNESSHFHSSQYR